MKFSYKIINWIFIFLYILPVAAIGFFLQQRVQQSLEAAQLFMQNQIDVDRKIITNRGYLRQVSPVIHQALLKGEVQEIKNAETFAAEKRDELDKFWKFYENNYTAQNRPFLKNILTETQELNLIEEESHTVKEIQNLLDSYFVKIFSNNNDRINYFEELDDKREKIYDAFNNLADIRYIFAQRIIFNITSQVGAQEAMFNLIFALLILIIIIIAVFQHFYIHRPLGDIMLFLKDMKAGQRRQRLYFSTPVKEIKESEEIINDIIETAEEHESHEEHK
ncbi:MAG: hypothetical protein HYW34_03815 [Candidatus Brennerbacteria bacterium]|nr:hypothetical protein [Candidatus Brennerbacteria bacterium]